MQKDEIDTATGQKPIRMCKEERMTWKVIFWNTERQEEEILYNEIEIKSIFQRHTNTLIITEKDTIRLYDMQIQEIDMELNVLYVRRTT